MKQSLVDELRQLADDLDDNWLDPAYDVCTRAADRIEQLEKALQSIAKNTCCNACQEAALVAREALSPSQERYLNANGDEETLP